MRLRWAGLLLFMVALGAVSGCGTLSALTEIEDALEEDGFFDVSLNLDVVNGVDTAEVTATSHRTLDDVEAIERAAEIVWREFDRRVDAVEVDVGAAADAFGRDELERRFGPRPAGLDDESLGDDVRRIGIGVVIALAVGGLLCAGLVILIVVLLVRSRRKRGPPPYPPGYGPPPHGAPAPVPPGYGQPHPQSYGQPPPPPGR